MKKLKKNINNKNSLLEFSNNINDVLKYNTNSNLKKIKNGGNVSYI